MIPRGLHRFLPPVVVVVVVVVVSFNDGSLVSLSLIRSPRLHVLLEFYLVVLDFCLKFSRSNHEQSSYLDCRSIRLD